jgi:general secretion pathway protein N
MDSNTSRWCLLVIGVAAYALALVVTAPATLLDASLERASEGRLRLAEARGTVWSGAGRIEIREMDGRTGFGRSVVWRIAPASLLRGALRYDVGPADEGGRFPVTLALSRIELSNAELSLPASVLGLAVPRLIPLGLKGEVLIYARQLSFDRDEVRGSATLRWRGAGSLLTPVSPLGEYELRLDGAGRTVHASLTTVAGPLLLDGKGSWKHGDSVAFAGTARVPPEHWQELAPVLRLIAVENGKGSFLLQLQ